MAHRPRARTNSKLAEGVATLQAHTDGYQLAFAVGAILCLLGGIAAVTLMGRLAEASAALAEEELPRRRHRRSVCSKTWPDAT